MKTKLQTEEEEEKTAYWNEKNAKTVANRILFSRYDEQKSISCCQFDNIPLTLKKHKIKKNQMKTMRGSKIEFYLWVQA